MRVCIVCQEDISGKKAYKVKEDKIIGTIRSFKRLFRIAANNELYVCEDHYKEHLAKRKSFERSIIFFGVLSAAIVILLIGTIILSGRFDIFAILSAIVIGFFVLLFSIVFKYTPALENSSQIKGKAPLPSELKPLEAKKKKGKKR